MEDVDEVRLRLACVGEIRGYERFVASITDEAQRINRHLPKNRKTLEQLLEEKEPKVESVDGSNLFLKRADLERAAEVLPDHRKSLHLPIILIRRFELGKGVFVVLGDKTERTFVRKTLGLPANTLDYRKEAKDELVLYYIQVQELLHKFRSLVSIGFGIPDDFALD